MEDLRRPVGAAGRSRTRVALGEVFGPDRTSARSRRACRAITRSGSPTEQIPEGAIGTSVCEDEFCALDPTASGETLRWIASVRCSAMTGVPPLTASITTGACCRTPRTTFRSINSIDAGSAAAATSARFESTMHVVADCRRRSSLRRHRQRRCREYRSRRSSSSTSAVMQFRKLRSALYAEATGSRSSVCALLAGLRGDLYDFEVRSAHGRCSCRRRDDSLLAETRRRIRS